MNLFLLKKTSDLDSEQKNFIQSLFLWILLSSLFAAAVSGLFLLLTPGQSEYLRLSLSHNWIFLLVFFLVFYILAGWGWGYYADFITPLPSAILLFTISLMHGLLALAGNIFLKISGLGLIYLCVAFFSVLEYLAMKWGFKIYRSPWHLAAPGFAGLSLVTLGELLFFHEYYHSLFFIFICFFYYVSLYLCWPGLLSLNYPWNEDTQRGKAEAVFAAFVAQLFFFMLLAKVGSGAYGRSGSGSNDQNSWK